MTKDEKVAKLWDAFEIADIWLRRLERTDLIRLGTAANRRILRDAKMKEVRAKIAELQELRAEALVGLVKIGAFDDRCGLVQIRNLLKDAGVKVK